MLGSLDMRLKFHRDPSKATKPTSEDFEVHRIELRLAKCPVVWIASVRWAEIAEIAASWLLLRRIDVDLHGNSEQHATYMQYAHPHLQSLAQNHGVELLISSPPTGGAFAQFHTASQ